MLPFVLNGELQLTDWRPSDPVVDAAYGGLEPRYRRAVPLEAIEAIVVPGIAFDRRGHRLGEGRGFVDGLLRRLEPGAIRIGLAYDEQILASVPTEPSDERVHAVATDSELIVSAEAFETERVR
jgi:5-formyltetrahydrofolate cyclo-ligase